MRSQYSSSGFTRVLLSAEASANSWRIKAEVVDQDGEPLRDAEVTVREFTPSAPAASASQPATPADSGNKAEGKLIKRLKTDKKGKFGVIVPATNTIVAATTTCTPRKSTRKG